MTLRDAVQIEQSSFERSSIAVIIHAMDPRFFDVMGNELVVIWQDGHESYYPLEALRKACPCASCSGEADLFGRVARGPEQKLGPRSVQVGSIDRVGNYGIQINWADGHTFGIWTFDRLRAFCACGLCREK